MFLKHFSAKPGDKKNERNGGEHKFKLKTFLFFTIGEIKRFRTRNGILFDSISGERKKTAGTAPEKAMEKATLVLFKNFDLLSPVICKIYTF